MGYSTGSSHSEGARQIFERLFRRAKQENFGLRAEIGHQLELWADGKQPERGGGGAADAAPGPAGQTDAGGGGLCLVKEVNIVASSNDVAESVSEGVKSRIMTFVGQQVEFRKGRCKSKFCPCCCVPHGIETRKRLVEVVNQWKKVLLITLTTRRDIWGDGEDEDQAARAYDYIRERRCIGRFVEKLKRRGVLADKHYFWVIEPHPGNPNWIHWHLIVPEKRLNFGEVWKAWQEQSPVYDGEIWETYDKKTPPPFGRIDLSDGKKGEQKYYTNEQAANYITGYVTKGGAWPAWFKGRHHVNLFGTSKRFWAEHGVKSPSGYIPKALAVEENCEEVIEEDLQDNRIRKEARDIAHRVASCGEHVNVFALRTYVDQYGELEERRVYAGVIPQNMHGVRMLLDCDHKVEPDEWAIVQDNRIVVDDKGDLFKSLSDCDYYSDWEDSRKKRIEGKVEWLYGEDQEYLEEKALEYWEKQWEMDANPDEVESTWISG